VAQEIKVKRESLNYREGWRLGLESAREFLLAGSLERELSNASARAQTVEGEQREFERGFAAALNMSCRAYQRELKYSAPEEAVENVRQYIRLVLDDMRGLDELDKPEGSFVGAG